jgi:ribosomal protection tetracycline resistance protein
MPFLNLGVVAHVDAGKTTLTERLLFETGVSTHLGRVDHGDTVTDSDDIERRRGITIRSAVVTFATAGTTVNLVDTPGHSDFVAEVERALAVLDGAVLVVSAVEGVQAQTRVLVRVLEQLGIPFLVFANKIDRVGADVERAVSALREAVSGEVVAMTRAVGLGARTAGTAPRPPGELLEDLADQLAERDPALLQRYVDGPPPTGEELLGLVTRHTSAGDLHPVYVGAALTGVGVRDLLDGLRLLVPGEETAPDDQLHASVFKIERDAQGHQVAYARVRSGSLEPRREVERHHRTPDGGVVSSTFRPTAVRTFTRGSTTSERAARAGEVARVTGLGSVEVGDQLGRWDARFGGRWLAPPGLEAVVRPCDPADATALFEALRELSAQDPLIDARLDGVDEEPTVSLYGEVQREVLAARLADEFGVAAEFLPTQVVHVERVAGTGTAEEATTLGNAVVAIRVGPPPASGGVRYRIAIERGWLLPSFHTAIEETVAHELRTGLHGWAVTGCTVTLVNGRYSAPTPSAGAFRALAASTLRRALADATTTVCAPVSEFEVGMPTPALRAVLHELLAAGATPHPPETNGRRSLVTGVVPTSRVHDVEARLPHLTGGEGYLVSRPAGHEPLRTPVPRRRTAG